MSGRFVRSSKYRELPLESEMRLPADRYRPRLRAIHEKGKGYLLLFPDLLF